MHIRNVLTISAVVIGMSLSTSMYASPTGISTPVHALFAKSKTIKMNVRNDSPAPLELKVGNDIVKVDSGKTIALKVDIGTRIVTNVATANHAAGEVLAEASSGLNDTTLAIR